MQYDTITRDLARKAADDACDAVHRTMALHPDLNTKLMISMMAAGTSFAIPIGIMSAKTGLEPEAVADALWQRVRPIVVDAAKQAEARNG